MTNPLSRALREIDSEGLIKSTSEKFLARSLASSVFEEIAEQNPQRLLRLAYIYESEGLKKYPEWMATGSQKFQPSGSQDQSNHRPLIYKTDIAPLFEKAFCCWRALLNLEGSTQGTVSSKVTTIIEDEFSWQRLPPLHFLAFHLAATGVLAQRTAEVRLELMRWDLLSSHSSDDWFEIVLQSIIEAFVLLTRKGSGWKDIEVALSRIANLRDLQSTFESRYLEICEEQNKQVPAALDLVGLYHLAQLINLTGDYLQTGSLAISHLQTSLDRHHDKALKFFQSADNFFMEQFANFLWAGCREIAFNSIWAQSAGLPTPIKDFVKILADRGRPNPIIELWPAQQEALSRNLLTTYHHAILVQMPTSAGKTLLAKFSIIQEKALNSDSTIAYVVPTRALVNQITSDLRSDFEGLKPSLSVEMTIPAFELDPTEDVLLQDTPDILVTTPEKLTLLLRSNHVAVSQLSMIVVDEAHNLGDEGRGARLELLLGTLKSDCPNVRFLLLSPFLPNNEEILAWLGEEFALPAITVDWRPGNRIVGSIDAKGRGENRRLFFDTLPAADNADIKSKWSLPISSREQVPPDRSLQNLTISAVENLQERGAILVLCKGKGTATKRAVQISTRRESIPLTEEMGAICAYLEAESGTRTPLVDCLKKGVVYHHAGISHETRWLLEILIKKGNANVICGTTTLAQGVNFPISTALIETLKKGRVDLKYEDFWNIAGRAGRTLMDFVGVVGFPTGTSAKQRKVEAFLRGEAELITSQLTSLIERADEIGSTFNMEAVSRHPGLSPLLQYLAHAMRVAGRINMASEVEDIMRQSLVYHQIRRRDRALANRLLSLCQSYLEDLSGKQNVMGLLAQSDKTGFSTPSVLNLRYHLTQPTNSSLREVSFWEPRSVFQENTHNLTQQIKIVGDIPEIRLGHGKQQPFNPDKIAGIIKDWVGGLPLSKIEERNPLSNPNRQQDTRLADFSQYLFHLLGIASWGIGALEGICLNNATEEEWKNVGYVPAMVFYGVKQKEGVWLRMVGTPRIVSDGLAKHWQDAGMSPPNSYTQIRRWVDDLSDREWRKAIPNTVNLTPSQCRILWNFLRN